jgi:hypothetical protein
MSNFPHILEGSIRLAQLLIPVVRIITASFGNALPFASNNVERNVIWVNSLHVGNSLSSIFVSIDGLACWDFNLRTGFHVNPNTVKANTGSVFIEDQ